MKKCQFCSSFLFQSPYMPSLTLPAVWICTLLYTSILLVAVLQELARCSATTTKPPNPAPLPAPLQKNPKTVVWIQLWTKLCDYPFLNKACTFYDLFYWCRSSQIFCLHRCTYKTLEDRQVLILILPGPVMVRVATDLLLKSCAV